MPKFLQQNRELFALVGMLLAVVVLMSILNPDRFFTPGNFRSMAFQLPEIGLFTLGMMTVMLHGGINLAIIGTANITGIITALVVHAVQPAGGEWPAIVTGVLAGFGVSLFIGLANGIIVGYIGISSILTTLGMMTLVNGTCILITGGSTISRLPAPLLLIGNGSVLGIPVPLLLFLISAMVLALLLRRTTFGFNLYMLGTNPIATRFAGIDNARTLLFAYLLSSVFASIAGLVMMARFNSAKADYGQSYLLISVLAAVLGGTNASGGLRQSGWCCPRRGHAADDRQRTQPARDGSVFCHHDVGGDPPAGDDDQSFSQASHVKRNHKPTYPMEYSELVSAVLEENRQVLSAVDPKAVDQLIDEILKAKAVHLYAMGRMQLSVRAFAMRLTHMGIPTHIVYDTTSPRIRPGDLLIGHCAVTNVELNVMRLAKDAGARIALLTAHPENEHGQLADLCVRVPGQIFGGPEEVKSTQPMASLLEQALFLFTDIVVMLLIERKGVSIQAMQENHTNLEGLPHAFA